MNEKNKIAEFINRNKLTLSRTDDEMKARFESTRSDFLPFRSDVLMSVLKFEIAKPHLKPEFVAEVESGKEKWEPMKIEEAAQAFLDYMEFAKGKAMDEMGISASRSIMKLGEWLWLLGREDLEAKINDDSLYNPYGAPALIAICEEMGIEVAEDLRDFSGVRCRTTT